MRIIIFLLMAFFYSTSSFAEATIELLDKKVLSWSPRIFVWHNFLSDEECAYLIERATPLLKRSTVSRGIVSSMRTSSSAYLKDSYSDSILQQIEERIALVTFIPSTCGEPLQVAHYTIDQQYQAHYDNADSRSDLGQQRPLIKQRLASFLMYLNTPEEGGSTAFPKINLEFQPQKGDALFFFNYDLEGHHDPLTFHAGKPVIQGEKWLATKWLYPMSH